MTNPVSLLFSCIILYYIILYYIILYYIILYYIILYYIHSINARVVDNVSSNSLTLIKFIKRYKCVLTTSWKDIINFLWSIHTIPAWRCCSLRVLASLRKAPRSYKVPTRRTRVSLFFWVITCDLSGMRDSASS